MKIKSFLKKNRGNLLILILLALLLIPQTGMPIKVFFNRLISFSPSELKAEKQETLSTYDWSLQHPDQGMVNFSKSEGRVALVNFWATWCPPCVAEMPSLQELYDDYGDRVDFYLISMEDQSKVDAFMEKNNYSLPSYIPRQAVPQELKGRSLPTTYVISKEGKIVIKEIGSANWNAAKVRELLDTLLIQ